MYAIFFVFGQQAAKQAVARDICKVDSPSELPAWAISSCAGGSAAVAAIVTNPMDVVKLRLQARTIAPTCWAERQCMLLSQFVTHSKQPTPYFDHLMSV